MGYMASNYHVLGVSENEDCLPNLGPSEERENDDRTKSLGKLFCWVPNFRTNQYLVDGIPTPLKNDGLRQLGPDDIPNMMGKSSKCSKPPTSQRSIKKSMDWFKGNLQETIDFTIKYRAFL